MFAMPFTKAAREKKRLKAVLRAAREFVYAHEDLPEFAGTDGRIGELRMAIASRDGEKCAELLGTLDPPKSFQAGREWLDVLVVSISVAMAFRAYFYEPFNIPTGSMQ
ncbi:MAG: S26 family signal peptidase, partial [Kiritimatiellae bacterium]|nr:S26 family signal peptidase [Kiritimatiellia bacterium]